MILYLDIFQAFRAQSAGLTLYIFHRLAYNFHIFI